MRTFTLSYAKRTPPTRIDVVQYTTAPDIGFYIEDFTPVGRAQIYIEKPSGEKIYNNCTIDGNLVVFTPTTQCFAEVGISEAQLQILDESEMAVSFKIFFIVEENIIDDSAVESVSEFTELQAAISTIGQYDQRIQDVQYDMNDLETRLTSEMVALDTSLTSDMNDLDSRLTGQFEALDSSIQSLSERAWQFAGTIGRDGNLNDFVGEVAQGWYRVNTGAIPDNSPYQNAFILEVIVAGPFTIQRATRVAASGRTAIRTKSDVGFTEWREFVVSITSIGGGDSLRDVTLNAVSGYVTGGAKTLRLLIPIDTISPSESVVSIENFSMACRGVKGYLYSNGPQGQVAFGPDFGIVRSAGSNYNDVKTFSITRQGKNYLNVSIEFNNAIYAAEGSYLVAQPNNTPIMFDIQMRYFIKEL